MFCIAETSSMDSSFNNLSSPWNLQIACEALHDGLWHQGRDRTKSLLKQRFYWPWINVRGGIKKFVH